MNTLALDPSRTGLIRKQFSLALCRRFDIVKRNLHDLIVKENALALNTRWAYLTEAQQLAAFKQWLQNQIDTHILTSQQGEEWFNDYVAKAYAKGYARSYDAVKPALATKLDYSRGGRAEFLSAPLGRPVSINRLKVLAARTHTDIEGVTDAMSQQINRTLADGLLQGLSPREVARNLEDRVEKIGKTRARVIAQSELIRAHAEGQLDSLEQLGISHVGIAVEFNTSGLPSVCPQCRKLAGIVLTLAEARGLIPVHPSCRCSFLPANVGESREGQVRPKTEIQRRLKSALRATKNKFNVPRIAGRRPKSIIRGRK